MNKTELLALDRETLAWMAYTDGCRESTRDALLSDPAMHHVKSDCRLDAMRHARAEGYAAGVEDAARAADAYVLVHTNDPALSLAVGNTIRNLNPPTAKEGQG